MEKHEFYVNIATGEISRNKVGNNSSFVIHATEDEVYALREQFDQMHGAGVRSFFRAHVPIVSYSNDKANDEYDASLVEAYRLLYELGDETTKKHIAEMNFPIYEEEKE
ncbi:hydrolase [Aciduricibacillus chroicocephali]|uniref:Hydrolase n=1 Tax=Aciduricibacillus chroicocephali TaxID=3054939 RepID=A0ABY9KSP7_9BACI|nr:hydrolase [Bacillaceae bacterium 44XB]